MIVKIMHNFSVKVCNSKLQQNHNSIITGIMVIITWLQPLDSLTDK